MHLSICEEAHELTISFGVRVPFVMTQPVSHSRDDEREIGTRNDSLREESYNLVCGLHQKGGLRDETGDVMQGVQHQDHIR